MSRFLATLFLLAAALPCNAESEWRVDPDFSKKKARKDISGAACGPNRCIVVNDETHFVQEFMLKEARIKPGERINLLNKDNEIDAEAIAYSDGKFYVAGSHGLSRKKARFDPAPFTVFRIDGDEITKSTRFREAIRRAPALSDYAEQPLNKNGANIEGLTARGDRLFFGFRGPSLKGEAFVLETSAEALFSEEPLASNLHALPLGERIGIRDLATVTDGILVLTGPVNTLPRRYTIALWQPENEAITELMRLPTPKQGKPEGVLVLGEDGESFTVLIFSDGARNGSPTEYTITKP